MDDSGYRRLPQARAEGVMRIALKHMHWGHCWGVALDCDFVKAVNAHARGEAHSYRYVPTRCVCAHTTEQITPGALLPDHVLAAVPHLAPPERVLTRPFLLEVWDEQAHPVSIDAYLLPSYIYRNRTNLYTRN